LYCHVILIQISIYEKKKKKEEEEEEIPQFAVIFLFFGFWLLVSHLSGQDAFPPLRFHTCPDKTTAGLPSLWFHTCPDKSSFSLLFGFTPVRTRRCQSSFSRLFGFTLVRTSLLFPFSLVSHLSGHKDNLGFGFVFVFLGTGHSVNFPPPSISKIAGCKSHSCSFFLCSVADKGSETAKPFP
jgi:hypothetical protein